MAAGDRAGARFGQYELRRLLGVGGMGEVYEAYDTVRDRVVAIKLLDVELAKSATYVERFRRESRTAARLQEPHVIPVHDWGEVDGVLYIDMRLVRGRDLKAHLHEDGPLSPADAVSVVEQVAAALDAAHETGLVHRDIKPGNIILTGELFAYLVDFGIAHTASDAQLTSTGSTIGSFAYMAPERFEHHAAVAPTSDIYALACVLYECLTGTPPFRSENNLGTIRAHMLTPPPQPSRHPGIPPAFDHVVALGMAKHPAQRYASAGQLARAARAALQHDSSATSPTGPAIPYPPAAQQHSPGSTAWPAQPPAGLQPGQGSSGPVGYPAPVGGREPGGYSPLPEGYSATRVGGAAGFTGPREHPSAPLPLPPKQRGSMPVLVGGLVVVVLLLGGVLGWVLLSGSGGSSGSAKNSAASVTGSAAQAGGATAGGQANTTVYATTLAPLVGNVSGTDGQGFVGGPRCNGDNPAVAYGRTASSRVLICRTGVGRYYYKGVRISDGAGIELDDPTSDGSGGWTVTNPKDSTQYRITSDALVITKKNGKVDSNETMIEYAHR
ncbi:protein kinase [Nocardia yamanashiensis]|uniref:serine/threonine-protein kinase n=1 Tax=Nocardia yamanashiensis TaxID=209247 RepID=UPI001E59234A|nr:serine/threonine-protein kinase [Nocardia yamanashiensis]UGT39159.1 protein kinase [Nocardia yamanashiensis]